MALVLTTETSWILGTGSAPQAPPELFDSAVNSWVNAPLLDEPVLPDEPLTIALQGSVDRVSLGHGLSIAVPTGWTSDVSDDRVILTRSSAVVVASIDGRRRRSTTRRARTQRTSAIFTPR